MRLREKTTFAVYSYDHLYSCRSTKGVAVNEHVNDENSVLDEQELLLELVRSLVHNPAQVKIDMARGNKTSLLTIYVDPADRGHVIGKGQRTLDALILLFSKAAYMDGEREVIIKIDGYQPRFTNDEIRCPSCGHNFYLSSIRRMPRNGPPKEFRKPT